MFVLHKKNNKRDYFISSSNIQTDAIIKIAVSTKPTNILHVYFMVKLYMVMGKNATT